jgi:hypothetical protein
LDDVLPLQTCYSTSPRLPHTCYLLNQGFQGHYFKHKEPQVYFNIYLTDFQSSCFNEPGNSFADMLQYILKIPSYLLPLKPRFSRSLLQTQGTSRDFNIYLTDIWSSGVLDNVIPSLTGCSTFLRLSHTCHL